MGSTGGGAESTGTVVSMPHCLRCANEISGHVEVPEINQVQENADTRSAYEGGFFRKDRLDTFLRLWASGPHTQSTHSLVSYM